MYWPYINISNLGTATNNICRLNRCYVLVKHEINTQNPDETVMWNKQNKQILSLIPCWYYSFLGAVI